jgi:4a-hydroxytetrahydrobiopterin dehydratase
MSDITPPAGWSIVDGKLHRVFTFEDFVDAFTFMTRVAFAAEKLNHHPDWSNSWNKVTIDIVSHDKGAITETCVALAEKANAAAGTS